MRLAKRERYIFCIAAIIIAIALFDAAVLSPIKKKLDKANKEIFIQEKKLKKFLNTLTQEGLIINEYKKYTRPIKQNSSDEEERARFLNEIEKLAAKTSIFLAGIKPEKIEKEGCFKKYTVRIEIESQISHLADFMYQLENFPRLLRIKDFYLIPKKKENPVLKAQMTITEILVSQDLLKNSADSDSSVKTLLK